jgi:hypothetical protein
MAHNAAIWVSYRAHTCPAAATLATLVVDRERCKNIGSAAGIEPPVADCVQSNWWRVLVGSSNSQRGWIMMAVVLFRELIRADKESTRKKKNTSSPVQQ